MAAMWFWKSGCRNNPTVPRTQTRTNIQRNSLSTTMATYFQSSMTWKKKSQLKILAICHVILLFLLLMQSLFMKIKGNKPPGPGNKLTLDLGRNFSPATIPSSGEKYCKYFLAVFDVWGTGHGCLVLFRKELRCNPIKDLFSLILICRCY